MKNQKEILTFEEYKNYLKTYPIFGGIGTSHKQRK